tara:strand:- start:454 stop:1350 length:897 start_codon:yes stop_codon:yes gene_type:complete
MNKEKLLDPNGINKVASSKQNISPGSPGNNAVSCRAEKLILSMANHSKNNVEDQNNFSSSSSYPGGKNQAGVYQTIINQIPYCKTFIEGCAGSGAMMRRILDPSIKKLAIEIDPSQFFRLSREFANESSYFIEHGNVLEYLQDPKLKMYLFNNSENVLFMDPPYPLDSISSKNKIYKFSWTQSQHEKFISVAKKIKCKVLICSYHNKLYDAELKDWRKVEYQVYDQAHNLKTEVLWMNYPEPVKLACTRYLGSNHRDRENLKRKKQRWLKKLDAMPRYQRLGILDVIAKQYNFIWNGE